MRRYLAVAGFCTVLGAGFAANAQTEFNASIWFPTTHPLTGIGYVDWVEDLKEASGGQFEPNLFTGTALLPPQAHLSGLRDGIAQLTYHAGTYTPTELPEDNTLSILGFNLRDIMVASFAATDFYINDEEMQRRFQELGVVYVGGYATPQYNLFCSQEVKDVSDLEGLKIRTPGPIHAEWARSVGAVPVSVPSTEMFTGLERGQLDCASNAANDLKSRSLWDVAKYTYTIPLGVYFAGWQYGFNKDFWAGLSDEQRRLLLDTIGDAIVDTMIGYQDLAAEALTEAPSHGVTVTDPTDAALADVGAFSRDVVRPYAIQQGKERFGVADPEGLVSRFEATVAKWEKLLDGIDRGDAAALKKAISENLFAKVDEASYGL